MFLCAIFYYEGHSILYVINSRGIKQTPAHASDSPFVSQNELPAPSGTQRLQTPRNIFVVHHSRMQTTRTLGPAVGLPSSQKN
jgi:hypothetical protein